MPAVNKKSALDALKMGLIPIKAKNVLIIIKPGLSLGQCISCADLVMSIMRIHISVRQMCVMCMELWRVEESFFSLYPPQLAKPSCAGCCRVL